MLILTTWYLKLPKRPGTSDVAKAKAAARAKRGSKLGLSSHALKAYKAAATKALSARSAKGHIPTSAKAAASGEAAAPGPGAAASVKSAGKAAADAAALRAAKAAKLRAAVAAKAVALRKSMGHHAGPAPKASIAAAARRAAGPSAAAAAAAKAPPGKRPRPAVATSAPALRVWFEKKTCEASVTGPLTLGIGVSSRKVDHMVGD